MLQEIKDYFDSPLLKTKQDNEELAEIQIRTIIKLINFTVAKEKILTFDYFVSNKFIEPFFIDQIIQNLLIFGSLVYYNKKYNFVPINFHKIKSTIFSYLQEIPSCKIYIFYEVQNALTDILGSEIENIIIVKALKSLEKEKKLYFYKTNPIEESCIKFK